MLEVLSGKLGTVKELTEEAFKSIGELEHTANTSNEWSKTQIDLLRAHREHLQRLATAVQFFQLEEEQKTASPEQDA